MLKFFTLAAIWVAAAFCQEAKPTVDNERVTVWDVTWTKEQANPARGNGHEAVVLWTAGGKVRTAGKIVERRSRQAFFSKGDEEGVADAGAPRSLVIALKDHSVPAILNKSGYPSAFPRPHARKLLENDRVMVWSYRWNPGEPTPMHFHDKDVIVVYLEETALVSTTPAGAKTLNEYKAFDVRFNKGDRTHTEELARGTGSAMMVELK